MIGALISGLFNFILGLVATAIQIIVSPLNLLITNSLPDLADALTGISQGFTLLFSLFDWVMALIPTTLLWTFGFCFGVRLVVVTLNMSTHTLIRVWNVLQKVKFW